MANFLFFAPNAGIWEHALPEACVAEGLKARGHQVHYLTCDRIYRRYCSTMVVHGVDDNASDNAKAGVCRTCNSARDLLRKKFQLTEGSELGSYLEDDDFKYVEKLMAGVTRENFLQFEVDGFPMGRSSLHEFLLRYKKNSFDFSDREWTAFQQALYNCLLTLIAGKRILDKIKPDFLVMYITSYSVNLTFTRLAEARGVPVYRLYAGSALAERHHTLAIDRGTVNVNGQGPMRFWEKWKDVPCSSTFVHRVANHSMTLMAGKHFVAYSAPLGSVHVKIRERFGVKPGQKLLLASMSSYDERFAMEATGMIPPVTDAIFPDQAAWVAYLIEYARKRPEVFLVLRVHPREFPNKREGVLSENAKRMLKSFDNLPENVRVNWPTDGISLYEIAEYVDVGLNSWSSVGKELAGFGIPVVSYSRKLICYPHELNFIGESHEDFDSAIDKALSTGWRAENIVKVYRWNALELLRSAIDVGVDPRPRRSNFLPWRILNKFVRFFDPVFNYRESIKNRIPGLPDMEPIERLFLEKQNSIISLSTEKVSEEHTSAAVEIEAVKAETRRLLTFMYGPERLAAGDFGPLGAHLKEFAYGK